MLSAAELVRDVERALAGLIQRYNFRVFLERSDPRDFGNCIIRLQSDTVVIRIIRERGQVFVDLGCAAAPGRLYRLGKLIALLGGAQRELPCVDLESAVPWLERYHEQLFDPRWYQERADELE